VPESSQVVRMWVCGSTAWGEQLLPFGEAMPCSCCHRLWLHHQEVATTACCLSRYMQVLGHFTVEFFFYPSVTCEEEEAVTRHSRSYAATDHRLTKDAAPTPPAATRPEGASSAKVSGLHRLRPVVGELHRLRWPCDWLHRLRHGEVCR